MYRDRFDAAEQLALLLRNYANTKNTIILAIPRGGLEIGYVLAKRLNLPLDIMVVKKLGHPFNEEYAIGAVGLESSYINEDAIIGDNISETYIKGEEARLRKEVEERYLRYRGKLEMPDLKNKTVIICDDGVATGITLSLSIQIIRKQHPKKIIVAIPVGPIDTIARLKSVADEIYCLLTPEVFFAIGEFYETFLQVSDEDAIKLLKEVNK